ncbi:MAG TPA: RNA polymerase sigma factor [Candidatus Acidoferrum sp.]|jgi:RNA polymerase sigma-70 factor (ECF subfamily)|nr:RNA polymerase sigma factor [Candidatus Acidoferrum sp.]
MEPDGNQLAESAGRGNKAAAVRLIDLFYERIYAFLRRLSSNDADAADLTQHTFKRAWQSLPTFAGRSSVGSWLHSIAYHVYVDWRRSNRHTEARSIEWWAACPAPEASPAEVAARNDLATTVYASVERLEQDLRDTVHLHYYQDLTLQETSEALGVATSTVKYRLRQALAELQKELASEGRTPRPSIAMPGNI